MGKKLKIELDSCDVSQVLDGLHARADSWRKTAEILRSDFTAEINFLGEECSDAGEAISIARHYEEIIASIEHQTEKQ